MHGYQISRGWGISKILRQAFYWNFLHAVQHVSYNIIAHDHFMFDNSAVFNQPATLKMMKCELKHFLRKKFSLLQYVYGKIPGSRQIAQVSVWESVH